MEALAIVLVLVVTLGIYVGARFGAGSRAARPAEELARLREYRRVLEEKIRRGHVEHWDVVMMRQLTDRLEDTDRRIETMTESA